METKCVITISVDKKLYEEVKEISKVSLVPYSALINQSIKNSIPKWNAMYKQETETN